MYQILLDGRDLYYPGDGEYITSEEVINLQLNDAGSFECDVPAINPEYKNIKNRISVIQALKDGKEIFCGEVRESEKDFNGTKHIYAVGELAYLFDSIQPQAEYHDLSPRQMLETWLNIHNSQVEEKKRIYIGIVTIHDTNDKLYRYTNRETTLDAIREKLIDRLGGYLKIRKANGKRYLDYLELADYGKICEQPIQFGENLLDYSENVSANDLYTALIPLGAKIETESENDPSQPDALEKYVDITSVNGGKDYLYIQAAVNKYGWCKTVIKWDDVNVPANLKAKGEKWLSDNQFETMTLNLSAVDLSVLNQEYDSFELGDSIRALAEPYGMDRFFPVRKMEIHLQNPDSDTLVLGDTLKMNYTDNSKDKDKHINNELEKVHITSKFLQNAIDNATQMMTGSKGGYKVTEFDENGHWLRDLYMNAPSKDQATRLMQINMNGIGFSRDGFNGPYKNAWTIDGVLLGEFIKAHSIQAEALSTEYITSVEKQITDAETGAKEWAKVQITTSIKAAEDRISLSVLEQRKYIDGIKETLSGEVKVTSEAITAEVKRARGSEEALSASIKVTADSIVNKVSKGEVESIISQQADSIRLKAQKLSWASTYSSMTSDGILTASSCTLNGKLITRNQNGNWIQLDSGMITGADTSSQSRIGKIDFSASMRYLPTGQIMKGIQITANEVVRISTPHISVSTTSSETTTTIAASTGTMTYVTKIEDAGNGVIRWYTKTASFINGFMTTKL